MKAKSFLVTFDGKRVNFINIYKLERNSDGTYTVIVDDDDETKTAIEKELKNEQN